jgi:hypothetical protein
MVLAMHVPAAMLFVPSRAGVSHSPEEYTAPELGARVLTSVVRASLRITRTSDVTTPESCLR